MGIAYIANPQNVVATVATRKALCNLVATTCFTSGWVIDPKPAEVRLNITGTVSDGDTVTFLWYNYPASDIVPVNVASATYTFKTAINNAVPNQVLISGSPTGNILNLTDAITGTTNSGVSFSSATIPSTLVNFKTNIGPSVSIYMRNGGPGNFATWTKSMTNSTYDNYGLPGWKMTSLKTAEGLQYIVYVIDSGTNGPGSVGIVNYILSSMNGDVISASIYSGPGTGLVQVFSDSGTAIRVIANSAGFVSYTDNVSGSSNQASVIMSGQVKPVPNCISANIVACNNATPMTITVDTPQTWVTGQSVYNEGMLGNLGGNGLWEITVISSTQARLNASASTGTWTSGGRCGLVQGTISQCFWGWESNNSQNFRSQLHIGSGSQCFLAINGQLASAAGGIGGLMLSTGAAAITGLQGYSLKHYDGSFLGTEAFLVGNIPSSSEGVLLGQFHNGLIIRGPYVRDQINTIDGHSFLNFTDNNGSGQNSGMTGSLMIAVT